MNSLLKMALENNQAKEYYGSYIIYPRRFMNVIIFDALLDSLKHEFNFYDIMGSIKAIPKINDHIVV